MYERMLNKEYLPNVCEIQKYIGEKANKYINSFIGNLRNVYEVKTEIKIPFGNKYGWGYKVNIKTKHLCYIFFESKAITVTIQIKKIDNDFCKSKYDELSDEGKSCWENRYPCGNGGGWIHYRILNNENFSDIGKFIMIKLNKDLEWIKY
jgi:hypothetical protein